MVTGDVPFTFEFRKIGSSAIGYISVAEGDYLPFTVGRVYWTYFTPDEVIRGNHAHKKLKQVLVAVSGQVVVYTEDKVEVKREFTLNKRDQGLFIPEGCWRTLRFSHDAVLLCLASAEFEEADYIRTYEEFKNYVKQ